MSFTRSSYDTLETSDFDAKQREHGDYMLNINSVENKAKCFALDGGRNAASQISRPLTNEAFLDLGRQAEIEAKLQNRQYELNDVNRGLKKDYQDIKVSAPNTCDANENFINQPSRYITPSAEIRGKNTFEYNLNPYLAINPQNIIVKNDTFRGSMRSGSSTRYFEKKDDFDKNMQINNRKTYSEILRQVKLLKPKTDSN
jgi:hypothetical protein